MTRQTDRYLFKSDTARAKEKRLTFARASCSNGGKAARNAPRGRQPARITAAQIDRVVNAIQPADNDRFDTRMENYTRQAEQDAKLYAWLERNGALPPPGKDIPLDLIQAYNREMRQMRAGQQSLLDSNEARS